MRLLLSLLSWPDGAKPEFREVDCELAIGRGAESGWKLFDPMTQLSRPHCRIAPFAAGWRVVDVSRNGTFINDSPQPLGRDQSHELHDGDRIRIGGYVIEARYHAPPSLQPPVADHVPFSPVRPGPPPPSWTDDDAWLAPARPQSFDLQGPAHDAFVGQPAADHSPAVSDIWQAPPPSRVVIPEDYLDDLDLAPLPAPAPSLGQPPPMAPMPPAAPAAAASEPTTNGPEPAVFAAFLRGAGLRDLGGADPEAVMESVGALLRVMMAQLREIQANRGSIKREFRILATLVRPEDNNPIKFSADNDAALRSLLTGRMPPASALGEILDEIRLHELAMIAAMRDAVRGLLDELSPAQLSGGEGGLLPLQRRARAFQQYEALHARITQALADDFDSVFGKAFARAYERMMLDEPVTPGRKRR